MLEYWNNGILGCWNNGMLEYWDVGMLEYWDVGILGCWNVGILECWVLRRGHELEKPLDVPIRESPLPCRFNNTLDIIPGGQTFLQRI